MEDCTFMRITPREMNCATISCYMSDSEEVRDEIQCLAYDIHVAINEAPDRIFIAHNHNMNDIEVHSVFGKDKKFKGDIILHGYDDTNFLMEYLCHIAKCELVHF